MNEHSSVTSDKKNKCKRLWARTLLAGAAAGILLIQAGITMLPGTALAEQADISVRHTYPGLTHSSPVIKPVWTAQVDNYKNHEMQYGPVPQTAAEDGRVFAFTGGKLAAWDASSGKRMWTYGKDLVPMVAYGEGTVYGFTSGHMLYAVNAKTGKQKWISKESTWIDTRVRTEAIIPARDTIYVIKGSMTFAFDAASGKLRWSANEPMAEGNGTDYLVEADGVVLRTFMIQGAITSVQLDAFDKKTGKKLWGHFLQGEGLKVENGLVYSIYDSSMLEEDKPEQSVVINTFNLKTGVKKGERVYSWKLEGEPPYTHVSGKVLLKGDTLYIEQGDRIAVYDFMSYKEGSKPVRTFTNPYDNMLQLVGIVQERLMYRNIETGELTGVKTVNGQKIDLRAEGVPVQIDIYGKGLFRGQQNGILHGMDLTSGQSLFQVRTGAMEYAPTLKTDGIIIIQTPGKLTAVKLPKSLR
ncbi:outer membrane protein assembly factor BamB family protein [Paenibacillus tarimensis]|uniref:outer membrane protein assembly factor BamB family protein n=1 Tax=Paenibacillus tarimensis TaxID=416012 RepID=UPI001F267FA4|nr:PQQ-binding-like beta-propeller repeat protein [Paenibacillus tarimensis]MCF2945704.1 PQQ-binding-like beta-propeller repeat protein [Paenibacillus tarimensis]